MDVRQLAAILLIVSFVTMALSMPFGVPGYYQTQNSAERIRLVGQNRKPWIVNKSLLYLWSVLTAVAVGALAVYLRETGAGWVAIVGAISVALGSLAYFLVNYAQHTDLPGYYAGKYPDYHVIGNWLLLAGLLFLGMALRQAGMPDWLSYLTIGGAIVPAIVLLIWPALFWLIPFLPGVPILLVIGIALWRQ